MDRNSKIYVAGHRGLVGDAVLKQLQKDGFKNLIYRSSKEVDLRNQAETEHLFKVEKPEYVILVAANHGGIQANLENKPEFLYDNLMINLNVIHTSLISGIKKIINIGASCVYPEQIQEPYNENMFLSGTVQEATEGYAWAKAMGMYYCQLCNCKYHTQFISLLPSNIYGNHVSFDTTYSSVLPAMLRRFHEAKKNQMKEVLIWGDGLAKREFIHVDDMSTAITLLLSKDCKYDLYNIGGGEVVSIQSLAEITAEIVGYEGIIKNDLTKPNGADRQALDCKRLRSEGWIPRIDLKTGIKELYQYAVENKILD